MTRTVGTHALVKVMIPDALDDRIEFACFRDSVDRGEFIMSAIKAACTASEAGNPIIRKEGN